MTKTNSLGIYVHIPFCIRKCKYCDFVSFAGKTRESQEDYVNSLLLEIKEKAALYKDRYVVDTIFFGGGTPTCLPAEDLIKILGTIKSSLNVNATEISFEANPGTISKEKLEKLKEAGFNRVSIGVQSFDDEVLLALGRIHDSEEASKAVKMALETGFNTNLDLMLGVPGQSLESFKNSLKKAIELGVNHISFYSLQLEEGTPLYEEYRYGDLVLPTWEENRQMYHAAIEMLNDAGYIHYEISNAAKPGFECKHNIKYWSMDEYLGFGLSAHSYIDGKRTGEEIGDPKGDFIFTRLRMIQGFEKSEYEKRFGISFDEEFGEVYTKLLSDDLLCESEGRVKFTKKGLDFTNPVMSELLSAID